MSSNRGCGWKGPPDGIYGDTRTSGRSPRIYMMKIKLLLLSMTTPVSAGEPLLCLVPPPLIAQLHCGYEGVQLEQCTNGVSSLQSLVRAGERLSDEEVTSRTGRRIPYQHWQEPH